MAFAQSGNVMARRTAPAHPSQGRNRTALMRSVPVGGHALLFALEREELFAPNVLFALERRELIAPIVLCALERGEHFAPREPSALEREGFSIERERSARGIEERFATIGCLESAFLL
jgi:hypothetical protein